MIIYATIDTEEHTVSATVKGQEETFEEMLVNVQFPFLTIQELIDYIEEDIEE